MTAKLAGKFRVYDNQVFPSKKQLVEGARRAFVGDPSRDKNREGGDEERYEQIGRLEIEVGWLAGYFRSYRQLLIREALCYRTPVKADFD